jgi:ABC-2 type transport system ATP-binding protein
MIQVTNLCKTYTVHEKAPGLAGSVRSLFSRKKLLKHAVRNVSFHVGEGEIVGLVGGIVHPTSGEAEVLGHKPWLRANSLRRQIALIMGQKASLWWDLPAADCFLLLKEIYQISDTDYNRRLNYLCDELDVRDQLKIQIRRLSLGERMKMELISTLLHAPRVLFLDEPTIGLDLAAQRSIREFLLKYREENQPAMILTSHYMDDIEKLCKRILLIQEGQLVFDGALQDVMSTYSPNKIVTASFQANLQAEQLPTEAQLPGKVLELTTHLVRLEVHRDAVTKCAQELLQRYPVIDISIEEAEIAAVIEQIFRDGQVKEIAK